MTTAITYNGFALNDSTYRAMDLNPMGSPSKDTTTLPLARADGSLRVFERYEAKKLVLTGRIVCATQALLEDAIDDLKAEMRAETGLLQYDWISGVRIHNCTAVEVKIDKGPGDLSTCPFQIVFECESPFSTNGTTDTLVNNVNVTTVPNSLAITVNGTYDAQPLITITINAIDPLTESQITVANVANSQYLTITETFAPADSLYIDCENYRVYKNGIFIPATGQFPSFVVGAGILEYSDDCISRDVTVLATAERRFL